MSNGGYFEVLQYFLVNIVEIFIALWSTKKLLAQDRCISNVLTKEFPFYFLSFVDTS